MPFESLCVVFMSEWDVWLLCSSEYQKSGAEHINRDVNKSHESGVFMGLTECNLYFFFKMHFEICITCSAHFLHLEFSHCETFEPICFVHTGTLFYLVLISVKF